MKYFLKTTYPCLAKTNQESVLLEEDDLLEIVDEEFVLIYPQNCRQIPFFINLVSPNENEFFSVINNRGERIIFLEPPQDIDVEEKESLNVSGKNCNITISDKCFTIENADKKITYMCHHPCKNYKIFKVRDFACIQFEHDFYAFNCKKNKLSHIQGDNLEFDDEKLVATRNFCDSDGRVRKATYSFEEEISVQEQTFVKNNATFPRDLTPYKLLESIKAKDFGCALGFLSEKLKQNIDEEKLKEFFGNVSAFLPLSTTEFITLNGNEKNFVKFEIQSDKIDDILIDAL